MTLENLLVNLVMFRSVETLIEAHKGVEREVYLDLENSTPMPVDVVEAMIPYFSEKAYGNPTITHKFGWMAYEEIPNVNILPSEKIASVKALIKGKALSEQELREIQEGLYLCTNCHKCTVACPVGINLQDLWFNVRETLLEKGYPELLVLSPLSFYRGLKRNEIVEDRYKEPPQRARNAIADACKAIEADETITDTHIDNMFLKNLAQSNQGNTFSYCFTCTTCTSACPVVRNFEKPREALGLVPHQIIHAAIVGVGDLIFSSNMLWDCLGCYQCQEQCPQGVRVTDVLYELKNIAMKQVNGRPKKS